MNKQVKVVHLLNLDGSTDFISSVQYTDYNSLVAEFKRGKFNTLLCSRNRTYLVTFTDGSTELWRNSLGDPSYVYTKVKDEPVYTDEGMCYKDALEYMALTGNKLYSSSGDVWEVDGHKLIANDELLAFPLHPSRFKELRLYKTKPKPAPVYIPFWDTVKAAGQDGKCISKFEDHGKGITATYRFNSTYPTKWEYWNSPVNKWLPAEWFLNHSTEATTYWAIVDDPSKES